MNRLQAAALALLLTSAAWSRPAAADCTTDTDCPGPACGGAVCQWSVGVHSCVAAGTDPQGIDGECASDADCKCATQGATCVAGLNHCSFTLSQDAGTSTGAAVDAGGSASSTSPGCALAPGRGSRAPAFALACAAAVAGLVRSRRARSKR